CDQHDDDYAVAKDGNGACVEQRERKRRKTRQHDEAHRPQNPAAPHPRSLIGSGRTYNRRMDTSERHLRLLTETIEAVNSTLDLQEVLELVAAKVANALGADACFVYLYDERAHELVLRATHGTRVDEMTRVPKLRPGEGITGVAAD